MVVPTSYTYHETTSTQTTHHQDEDKRFCHLGCRPVQSVRTPHFGQRRTPHVSNTWRVGRCGHVGFPLLPRRSLSVGSMARRARAARHGGGATSCSTTTSFCTSCCTCRSWSTSSSQGGLPPGVGVPPSPGPPWARDTGGTAFFFNFLGAHFFTGIFLMLTLLYRVYFFNAAIARANRRHCTPVRARRRRGVHTPGVSPGVYTQRHVQVVRPRRLRS